MELHLKIIGVLLVVLALVHIPFPKRFGWKKEFASVSLLNRQMMYIHTFFIGLVVVLIGILCLVYSSELIYTPFGRSISLGIGIFWGCRLVIQFVGYSSKLWRGKTFETVMHILFSVLWIYLTTIFFMIYFNREI